jgi:predicted transcriptional regulator
MDEVDTTVRATTPEGEVEDFIIDHHNYFPMLETAAAELRARVEIGGESMHESLLNYLAERHGLTLKRAEADVESVKEARPINHPAMRIDYLQVGNHLKLQDWYPPESERFLITQFIFELEYSNLLHEVTTDKRLTSEDARARARRAMARYAAGAVLYPYELFLEKAKKVRYDIQVLQHHFGGSFEQISHRLITLQRPGSIGVPFFYIRTDLAGNISKRFSLPNLHLPRYGGVCPLWALYRAFLVAPDQIISQRVQMPDKQEFLFIARTVKKQANTFGETEKIYSVMLGCDAVYADQLVYGSGNDTAQSGLVAEVGSNCRLCPRPTCAHRAYAPFLPVVH